MLIKTPEFEANFLADVSKWITINKRRPLHLKGSYLVKQYGEVISDIDLEGFVDYRDNFHQFLYNIIRKNISNPKSPFSFIQLGVGRYDGFKLPWSVDNNGGCDYNPQKVKEWFSEFSNKNLVPQSVIKYIREKLFSEYINIRNLIDIETTLLPYSEINWSPKNIQDGFIVKNGKRYYLIDAFKTETPVLEYIYSYDNQFIAIDLGLVDKNYRTRQTDAMYKYYTQNWYKVLKNYRWKIKPEFQPELLEKTGEVNKLIALRYEIELFSRIQKIPNFSYYFIFKSQLINDLKQLGFSSDEKSFENTEREIEAQINDKLENYVQYFIPMLDHKYKSSIIQQLERGQEAQNPVNQQQLNERHAVGIKCPFFQTDTEEYEILSKLAVRLNLPTDFVVNCFSKIAIETKIPLQELVQTFAQNNYSISILESNVILRKDTQELGIFPLNQLNILRIFVLVFVS